MVKIRRNNIDYLIKESNGKVRYSKKCPVCERDFLSSRSTAVYCSNSCKQGAYYYRHNEKARLLR